MSTSRPVTSRPVTSRKCKSAVYIWDRRTFQQHRLKVREAKATVNMKTPERRPHILYKAKRLQFERDRQEQIARDNFILYKRLTDIMSGKLRRKYPITQQKSNCIKLR
ncbi:PREDICTED: uncharacterized protein LOC105365263 [Ceratosolen solmsi marchali]|uniref:Uncharacterized protein LOC105365263 n=1 Tax=Ceratosolen solmsi marchali TaxID=326594 RepID=A0AAJ6YP63_9HYME|nr:PREDICTED: uncharacterized protein LOC105365263 [Ceratosolen solmsi marchali]